MTGTIMGRGRKATGKYKTQYNVRGGNNEEIRTDLGVLEQKKIPETEINMTTIIATDKKKSEEKDIIMAKENELPKLAQFNIYEEMVDSGKQTSST